MDRQTDGWTSTWVNEWTNGRIDERMENAQIDLTDRNRDRCTKRQTRLDMCEIV
jgi:hypothetical protein